MESARPLCVFLHVRNESYNRMRAEQKLKGNYCYQFPIKLANKTQGAARQVSTNNTSMNVQQRWTCSDFYHHGGAPRVI